MPLYTRNLFILLTSTCLFFSSFYLLLPTLPEYTVLIGGDYTDVGIVIGAFTLSSVLFRPIAGKFTDRYGRKPLLISGAVIFFLSPFLYLIAGRMNPLLLVRIFHGVGIAAFTVSSVTMIADMSPFFTAVFLAEAVLAAISVFLSLLVEEPARTCSEGTYRGGGWLLPSAIIFLCTVTYGSIVAFLPFFAGDITGLYYTSYALSSIVVRIPIGRISDSIGRQRIIVPGLLIMAVSLIVLSRSHSLFSLMVSGALYGLGFSSCYPTLTAFLVDKVPEEARAYSLSCFTASFDLGIAAGSFIFGLIPLFWIYPLGAVVAFSAVLLFCLGERFNSCYRISWR